jgi:hypothetical protein
MVGANIKRFALHNSVIWDGKNDFGEEVSAGVYLYQIRSGAFSATGKCLLLKTMAIFSNSQST